MADRAKRAAFVAGMVGVSTLTIPIVTASIAGWTWDAPTPCQEHAMSLPTTTGATPSIWRKPHYFGESNGGWKWAMGTHENGQWTWSPSVSDVTSPGTYPSAGWSGLSDDLISENGGPWFPIDYTKLPDDQDLIDALRLWFPDAVPLGVRNNYCTIMPPRPGDFLPPSPTIGGGSYALVPNASASKPTTWNGLEHLSE